jgi:predicted Zn-dependent protease
MRGAFKASTIVALTGFVLMTTSAWAAGAPSSTASTKQPAPGTSPVGGDHAAPNLSPQTTPCAEPGSKRAKRRDRDRKSDDNDIQDAEPGLVPLSCPGGEKEKDKVFEPDKVVGVGSHMIKIKPGSIEDVNAVGDRDIGGRGMGNWYSIEDEIKMGKSYADQVDKSARFITDPVVDEYINRIGQNIVRNSDCKVPFTIKVIDSDQINAFALPGGFFYVNSGLILAADEEAELAGVMSHETAHVCAHHAAREMTRMHYAQLGMIPLMIFTGYTWTGYGIYEASQLAIPIAFLKFSRDFEAQADYLGVQYMYRAGYDPQAYIRFFEKIEALQKRRPGIIAAAFSDHPETPDRILHTQEEIAEILPARDEYLETTSEFNAVKARLARIENRRRLVQHNRYRPSLRRASTSNNGSGTDTVYRPTLHRRDDEEDQN